MTSLQPAITRRHFVVLADIRSGYDDQAALDHAVTLFRLAGREARRAAMGMWDAVSDYDYFDEQTRWDRTVEMMCPCGAVVRVPFRDGPPLGPLRCADCQEQALQETIDRLRSQTRLSR